MKKIAVLCVLALLFALLSTGCVTYSREDYYKAYKPFLEYSLGAHSVTKEKYTGGPGASPLPAVYKGTQWSLGYRNAKGEDKVFVFNNTEDFAQQLINYLCAEAEQMLAKDAFPQDLPKGASPNAFFDFHTGSGKDVFHYTYEDAKAALIDKETGVRLAAFTPAQLLREGDFTLRIRLEAENNFVSREEQKKTSEELLPLIRNYVGQAPFYIELLNALTDIGRETKLLYFDEDAQAPKWGTSETYWNKLHTEDGILMKVKKLSVGGEDVSAQIYYHPEHETYYLGVSSVNYALASLGIEPQSSSYVKNIRAVQEWEAGENTYTYEKLLFLEPLYTNAKLAAFGNRFYQNGQRLEVAIEPRAKELYIPLASFASLLNGKGYFDEETKTIVIETAQQ